MRYKNIFSLFVFCCCIIAASYYFYGAFTVKNIEIEMCEPYQLKKCLLVFAHSHGTESSLFEFFSSSPIEDGLVVLNQWLIKAVHTHFLEAAITCQTIIFDPSGSTVYISFDYPLLHSDWSIEQKIRVVNSIVLTVHDIYPTVSAVFFLVRHAMMTDSHIDFTIPCPIKGYQLVTL